MSPVKDDMLWIFGGHRLLIALLFHNLNISDIYPSVFDLCTLCQLFFPYPWLWDNTASINIIDDASVFRMNRASKFVNNKTGDISIFSIKLLSALLFFSIYSNVAIVEMALQHSAERLIELLINLRLSRPSLRKYLNDVEFWKTAAVRIITILLESTELLLLHIIRQTSFTLLLTNLRFDNLRFRLCFLGTRRYLFQIVQVCIKLF